MIQYVHVCVMCIILSEVTFCACLKTFGSEQFAFVCPEPYFHGDAFRKVKLPVVRQNCNYGTVMTLSK